MSDAERKFEKEFYERLWKDMHKPRIKWLNVLYLLLALAGITILAVFTSPERVIMFLRYNSISIGVSLIAISLLGVYKNYQKNRNFVDVDLKRSYLDSISPTSQFEEHSTLPDLTNEEASANQSKFFTDTLPADTANKELFVAYFYSISKNLKDKAKDADEKASLLLDKGVTLTMFGIFFFLSSIVAWQYLSYKMGGFKEQFVYGIVSCSVLFVFIEFLSAWFLKQYRHFVDTSTYLLKVKSILDRYLLTYYALLECPVDDASGKTHTKHIFSLLSEEIKWPDNHMIGNKDISFAKEAMDAMTAVAKTLKSEISGRKKTKKDQDDED